MSGQRIDLAALRENAEKATPGPWGWFGNTKAGQVYLATKNHGRRFVMTFTRLGTHSAQPMFRSHPGDQGLMMEASELARYEVLGGRTVSEAGKEPYRYDLSGIANADADFIANASPDVVLALVEAVEAARRVAQERTGHELGGEHPLYVKLCTLHEALAPFVFGDEENA